MGPPVPPGSVALVHAGTAELVGYTRVPGTPVAAVRSGGGATWIASVGDATVLTRLGDDEEALPVRMAPSFTADAAVGAGFVWLTTTEGFVRASLESGEMAIDVQTGGTARVDLGWAPTDLVATDQAVALVVSDMSTG